MTYIHSLNDLYLAKIRKVFVLFTSLVKRKHRRRNSRFIFTFAKHLKLILHYTRVSQKHKCNLCIRLEARLQPNIGNTLGRVSTVFTRSDVTPPRVNRFGWNQEHSEHSIWGWPRVAIWHFSRPNNSNLAFLKAVWPVDVVFGLLAFCWLFSPIWPAIFLFGILAYFGPLSPRLACNLFAHRCADTFMVLARHSASA